MKFTIFTPSYNRAHTLPRLFDSLKKQTFQDFEWLIVDDGSTDETQKIIEEIQRSEKTFPIIYLKTENGGKHRAINLGLKHAKGTLFFIVDSDDYLPENSLEPWISWKNLFRRNRNMNLPVFAVRDIISKKKLQ
ncbi:MAG: glycosyltransferase family 2 protein [Lentisphaeria bacterium]|nr:glycosyltransferase family 2 protein [Lentisphaeria bacterium]